MIQKYLCVWTLLFWGIQVMAQLSSPDEFLPHRIGETFPHHHQIIDYFEHVAANSSSVQLKQYGMTNEDRPLVVAYLSAPENMARLEQIRTNHLRKAKMIEGDADTDENIAVVWLSFGVHGNEAAASSTAPYVLHQLADPNNQAAQNWLKNTLVIIDPALNPDGYARYTQWYRQMAHRIVQPELNSREHREPWPGGRSNHYYFDLNRDWAWSTQLETKQRLAVYHQWLPHIHVDVHEQGINSPYYFAPAAKPYHAYITSWQRDFQKSIGENHARYFDEKGWLYFTKEIFDLLYPSYGDTYPMFNGAIGMTYEQGGSSRAGRAVLADTGDTLTLRDRIQHHTTTAISTVETASKYAEQLNRNFEQFYEKASTQPPGVYDTFIISGKTPTDKLRKLTDLLDRHHIEYGHVKNNRTVSAYSYENGRAAELNVSTSDLAISAYQPQGTLVQVLFEPEPQLVDSLTYDITAWSLPFAHGLEAYATEEALEIVKGFELPTFDKEQNERVARPYAYLIDWETVTDAQLLGALLQRGIKVRVAQQSGRFGQHSFSAGALIISSADNRQVDNLDQQVTQIANEHLQPLVQLSSGWADKGADVGSSAYTLLDAPKVAVLQTKETSPYSLGEIWHYFEHDIQYPLHIVQLKDLKGLAQSDFSVVILPEGRYRWEKSTLQIIDQWTREGGKLIAIGSALRGLANQPGFKLKYKVAPANGQEEETLASKIIPYGKRQRNNISNRIPGAIFQIPLDNTHPLGFGMPDHYFSLKIGTARYDLLSDSWNVGYVDNQPRVLGFAGSEALRQLKNSAVFAVTAHGRGHTIYMVDNPLFRGFWEQGKMLFSNAVFLVD